MTCIQLSTHAGNLFSLDASCSCFIYLSGLLEKAFVVSCLLPNSFLSISNCKEDVRQCSAGFTFFGLWSLVVLCTSENQLLFSFGIGEVILYWHHCMNISLCAENVLMRKHRACACSCASSINYYEY